MKKITELERLINGYLLAEAEKNKALLRWHKAVPHGLAKDEEEGYLSAKKDFDAAAHALAQYVMLNKQTIKDKS